MRAATATTFVPYTLMLNAPAIATTLSSAPNSAVTQPFIPGGAIRGAVAARLLAEGEPADGDVFRDLILTGTVRYLHAYPEIDGRRAMPAPLSWRSEKRDPSHARDLAAFSGQITEDADAEDLAEIWPEETLVSIGAPFAAPTAASGGRSVATPRIDARLHQQRDRVKGRPWLEQKDGQEMRQGALFAYEYLEPRQVFRGAIQVTGSSSVHIERLKRLLNSRVLLGRSRRAGYGGDAAITFDRTEMSAEYVDVSALLTDDVGNGNLFRMSLVSAYVGRHPATGQLDPSALDQDLRQRCLDVDVERRCWSFETVGSFNQKWRLATPQAPAVAAGSVFVLRARKPLSLEMLRDIEREGLGERRVEGFGRVLFLRHHDNTAPFNLRRDAQDIALVDPQAPVQRENRSGEEQLAFLEQRIVLSPARLELDRVAADIAKRATKPPTNSLLGRIRTLFRSVHDETTARSALQNLRAWCDKADSNALKPEARKKLCACRVGDSPLLEWLDALAQTQPKDGGWQRLVAATGNASTLTGLAQRHFLTATSTADQILRDHSAELTVHLIDAVLAMMARRNRGGAR